MSYRITIEEIKGMAGEVTDKIYEQTIEEIDLRAVMAAVNKRPRKQRSKADKKDEK